MPGSYSLGAETLFVEADDNEKENNCPHGTLFNNIINKNGRLCIKENCRH